MRRRFGGLSASQTPRRPRTARSSLNRTASLCPLAQVDGTKLGGYRINSIVKLELRSLQICFLITPTTFGARGTEKGSAHEEATVTKHRRANCRTCHGVSAEHAERRTIAGRRTIQWRRTTRARRAGATEYATRRPRWERPVSVPAQPARPDLRAGSAGTAGPEQARSA
jgi:hypothetical protein